MHKNNVSIACYVPSPLQTFLYAMLMFKLMPALNPRARENTNKHQDHSLPIKEMNLFILKLIN